VVVGAGAIEPEAAQAREPRERAQRVGASDRDVRERERLEARPGRRRAQLEDLLHADPGVGEIEGGEAAEGWRGAEPCPRIAVELRDGRVGKRRVAEDLGKRRTGALPEDDDRVDEPAAPAPFRDEVLEGRDPHAFVLLDETARTALELQAFGGD